MRNSPRVEIGIYRIDVALSVETLVINSATTVSNARIDLANVTGLTALQTVFITGGTLSQIAVDKLASGVAVKTTGTVTNDNLVIDLTDKAAADNALSLEIGGVAAANDILNIDAAGVETLNIKASNTNAATLDLAGVAATATAGTVTVNVTGAGGVIFKTLSALTNVVNASAATGAITLASADRAATAMTITTGTAADSVAMRHANDVLNGGLGTDTLVLTPNFVLGGVQIDLNSATDQITTFNGSANAAVQIGFENVDLSGITGSFGADVTAKSTGSTITGTANSDVITGGAGADTVNYSAGNDAVTFGGGNDTFNLTDAQFDDVSVANNGSYDLGTGTGDIVTITNALTGVDADFVDFTNAEILTISTTTSTLTVGTAFLAAGFTTIDSTGTTLALTGSALGTAATSFIAKGYTVNSGAETFILGGTDAAWDDAVTGWTIVAGLFTKTSATVADFYTAVAGVTGTAGEIAIFVSGADTYVYAEGVATGAADDSYIVLTGVNLTSVSTTHGALVLHVGAAS